MAIAHFGVGFFITTILLVAVGESDREETWFVAMLGGVWGLVPDIHWVLGPAPKLEEWMVAFHSSRWADVFMLHYTFDVYDPSNSEEVAFAGIAAMFAAAFVLLMNSRSSDR